MERWIANVRAELDELQRLSLDELRARQNERLASLLDFHLTNERNPGYRALLQTEGIASPADLPRGVDELDRLPLVTRRFLQEADYAGHPCVPPDEVRKVIETSGTSGVPLRIPHTHEATRRGYGDLFARSALLGGIDPADPAYLVVHWVPGGKDDWASHESVLAFQEIVGREHSLIVSTHTTMAEHWHNITSFRPHWAASAPPFFLALAEFARHEGLDLAECSLRLLLLGGASCMVEDRQFLERVYGLDHVHMFYATSESFYPGAELPDGSGYLCFEDEIIVEVVDINGRHVKPGERGRVATTVLSNRGFPCIRYLQGDVATYVGQSAAFPGLKVIRDIRRVDAGEIGEGRLPFSEIELMPRHLRGRGIPVRALQIARRREGLKDVPVIRVETPIEDRERVERAVIEVFMLNAQMKDQLDGGMIIRPVVELYPMGTLSRGRFKVPLYVDERDPS